MSDFVDQLRRQGVLPVVSLPPEAVASTVVQALVQGGLRTIEITLRSDAALDQLREADRADVVIGAGTVRTPRQAAQAVEMGARFVVSPGTSVAVIRECHRLDVPVLAGVATATEIMTALDEGVAALKFFPARALGGPPVLRALAAPFPDAVFVPTGGISADTAADYLALPQVAAVGGSWLAPADLVRKGALDRITRLAAGAARGPAAS